MLIGYKELCSVSMTTIIGATCFIMGVFYSNLSYDARILFNPGLSEVDYETVLRHYQLLSETKRPLLYILAFVAFLGLLAHCIRTFKPNEELKYFEYGSLVLYIFGICVFITNIKTGIDCTLTHEWGDVDEKQGLAVLASSTIIMLCLFAGVIFIQIGLWYSILEYEQRMEQFKLELQKDEGKSTDAAEKPNKKNLKKNKKNN